MLVGDGYSAADAYNAQNGIVPVGDLAKRTFHMMVTPLAPVEVVDYPSIAANLDKCWQDAIDFLDQCQIALIDFVPTDYTMYVFVCVCGTPRFRSL